MIVRLAAPGPLMATGCVILRGPLVNVMLIPVTIALYMLVPTSSQDLGRFLYNIGVINVGLLCDEPPQPGEWVLIHVGFALSKIDESEAAAALEFLEGIGQAYEDELAALQESRIE